MYTYNLKLIAMHVELKAYWRVLISQNTPTGVCSYRLDQYKFIMRGTRQLHVDETEIGRLNMNILCGFCMWT